MIVDLLLALIWYLTLTGFGLMVLPLSMRVFRRLPERGILLARPLGWLLLTCITWQLCHWLRLPFYAATILVVGVGLFALSVWMMKRNPTWYLRAFRQRWKTARNGEIITLLVFVLFVFVRGYDSNVDHTEKPMDLMMLSALTYATSLPPQDLWYAGEVINYHYASYLLHAIPAKLLNMTPEYTYNLAIPSLAAMAASVAFVLGRALFGRCRWGALSVLTTLFVGNLASVLLAFSRDGMPSTVFAWRWEYLFKTSRVIIDPDGDTINEFPFFTLLWSDVHPHFSNIPFFLFFMALMYALLLAIVRLPMARWLRFEWPLLLVMLASGSMLLPTNIFDFPVLSFFFGAVLLLGVIAAWRTHWQTATARSIGIGVGILLLPIFAYLAASVFWLHFTNPLSGAPFDFVPHRSSVFDFAMVFGFHTLAMLAYVGLRFARIPMKASGEEIGFVLTGLGILFVVLWALTGAIVATVAPMIALLVWILALLCVFPKTNPFAVEYGWRVNELFCLVACALAWTLIAACEYIYLPDSYGIRRMNTLFKFHFPAWLLMGIALPPLLFAAIRRLPKIETRWAAGVPLTVLLAISLIGPAYTLSSFYFAQKNQPFSLNGLTFAEQRMPGSMEIVRWLRENADYDARLLEIPGGAYQPNENLVSGASGRASLIGWAGHEHLWRGKFDPVFQRRDEAVQFFTTKDWPTAQAILNKHEIDYVVFTPITQSNPHFQRYTEMMFGAFRSELEPVVQSNSGQTFELYRVNRAGGEG